MFYFIFEFIDFHSINNVQHDDEILEIEILEETDPPDPILVEDSDDDVADELIDVVNIEPSSNVPINPNEDLEIIEEIYPPVNVPVTPNLIDLTTDESDNHFPEFERHSSIDNQECPICLETFDDLQSSGTYLMITACRHVLCIQCIRQLLANYSQCPLCRENLNLSSLMPYCILT